MPKIPDLDSLPDLIPGGPFDPKVPEKIPLELGLLKEGDDLTSTADDGLDAAEVQVEEGPE